MKVNTITISPTSLKKQKFNSGEKSKVNKTSFMSDISFKGYMSIQSGEFGTSGGIVSEYYVDKGWYSGIKKTTKIKDVNAWGHVNYGVYIADIDEKIDRSKLPWNADFLVEYEKPQPITFKNVKDFIQKGEYSWGDYIKFDKQLDYTRAWKDLHQKQFDDIQQNLNTSTGLYAQKAEIELKIKTEILYNLGKQIDGYTQLNQLVQKADELARLQYCHNNLSSNLEQYTYKKVIVEEELISAENNKKSLLESVNNGIKFAQKAYDDAPSDEKDEYQAELTLAKAQLKQAKTKLIEFDKQIEELNKHIKNLTDDIIESSENKNNIENNPDFQTANSQRQNILEQIRRIYEECFPENLGE